VGVKISGHWVKIKEGTRYKVKELILRILGNKEPNQKPM
jgi:hypothetical protein